MSVFAKVAPRAHGDWLLFWKLALRELRGGIRGFYVFIACIAIGVMSIAGVGSVAQGLFEGLAREGRVIVGGDVFTRPDGAALASLAAKAAIDLGAVKDGWNGFSVLHTAASRVGALDGGFLPADGGLSATWTSPDGKTTMEGALRRLDLQFFSRHAEAR